MIRDRKHGADRPHVAQVMTGVGRQDAQIGPVVVRVATGRTR